MVPKSFTGMSTVLFGLLFFASDGKIIQKPLSMHTFVFCVAIQTNKRRLLGLFWGRQQLLSFQIMSGSTTVAMHKENTQDSPS